MKVKITPFNACGEITAPPSKSFAHRYLIAAYLAGKKCTVKNVGDSDDVNATFNALKSLGGKLERRGDDIMVFGREKADKVTVDCAESGSTMRFLLPVASALGITAEFTGSERLLSRPIEDIARAVEGHGGAITGHKTNGQLQAGKYILDGSLSSQFVTGLMFALSVLKGESEIVLNGKRVSAGYIDITLAVLREFGVKITETATGYKITGGYNPPSEVTVEGDWSSAAFMLSVGALTGEVTVKNLKYPSLQSDSAIVDILRKFGATVTADKNSVTAKKGEITGVNAIDCENCPDIAQVISSIAAFYKGDTVLTGIKRLKIKESDRINAIIKTLASCGIKAVSDGENLTVFGGNPKGGIFDGGNDHRTVMSSAVIACGADGVSVIDGAEHCAKSYPEFFEDLKRLGGKVDVNI